MYIQNGRDISKFNDCSPPQNRNGLIGLKSAISCFAYTQRLQQACKRAVELFRKPKSSENY